MDAVRRTGSRRRRRAGAPVATVRAAASVACLTAGLTGAPLRRAAAQAPAPTGVPASATLATGPDSTAAGGDSAATPSEPRHAAAGARPRLQLYSEMEYNANQRRHDSPLNPGNVARLPAGEAEWRLFPVAESVVGRVRARADVRLRGRQTNTEPLRVDAEAQELVAGVTLSDALYLAVGRQRLGWGTGLAANPTRLEAQRDAFRLANRTRGTDVARLEWVRPALTTNLVVSPARTVARSLAALRAERTFGAAAASVSAVTRGGRYWRLGGDVAVPMGAVTLFAEGTASQWTELPALDTLAGPPPEDPTLRRGRFVDLVAGGIWAPRPAVRIAGEYRYQSDYLTRPAVDAFVRTLPNGYARYDPLGMGRHRIFVTARVEQAQRMAATLNVFVDPVTRQALVAPTLEASGSRVKLEVSPLMFVEARTVSALTSRVQAVLSVVY